MILQNLIPTIIQVVIQPIIPTMLIDAIVKNQDKKKFKSILVEKVDGLRNEASDNLDKVGRAKIDLYLGPIKDFMKLYSEIVINGNDNLKSMIDIPLSADEIKRINEGIQKAEKLFSKEDGKLTKAATIGWAVFGYKVSEYHSYPEGNRPYNSTVMWLGDDCFRKDDKKGFYMSLFDGKIPGYLLYLYKYRAWEKDIKHLNELMDEKYILSEEELENLFNHQLPETFAEFKILLELLAKHLDNATNAMKERNTRLEKVVDKLDDSRASNLISSILINETIPLMRELVYLDSTFIFTTRGAYTERFLDICNNEPISFQYTISDEELQLFIKRFLDVKTSVEDYMQEINIKIIDSDKYSDNTEYYKYDDNEKQWIPFSNDLNMMIKKKQCRKFSVDNFEYLFDLFDEYLAISDLPTSIYYIGENTIYDEADRYIANRYSYVKIYNV